VIRRAGLTRARWDELLDWTVEKQGMTPLEPNLRTVILDYLATAFPARRGRERGANPFMTDD
jgi:cytochrome c